MMAPLDWTQISTIITAAATVAYAVLTIVIVRETVKLRRAQTEPNIVLLIQPQEKSPNLYDIIIKNTGSGAAYDLKWQYDKTTELASKENIGINRFEFFQGTKYFAPGQEFHSFLGSGMDLLGRPFLPALEIALEYKNESGKRKLQKFVLDPSLLYGHSWIGNQPDMAESLHAIEREIRNISIGFHRLKVDIYDKADRKKETQEKKHLYEQSEVKKAKTLKRKR